MKKILFFLVIVIISISARAQHATVSNQVIRSVQDHGVKGVDIAYVFN